MSDFFLDNYVLLTHSVEFLAALTGVFFIKKYNHSTAKYFIWFLIYIAVIDLLGGYARYINKIDVLNFLKDTRFKTSHWWATVFWNIGSALFISFYYSKILNSKFFISIIKIATILFVIGAIVSIILDWSLFFNRYSPFVTVSGAIVILLCTSFHMIEILRDEKIIMFYKSINFFISGTFFIWFIITTPLVLYNAYYSSSDWNFVFFKWQIFLFANLFMYLTFTFSLIYCEPEHKNQ